jgi:hypothetical protein
MPQLPFSRLIAAGATDFPLSALAWAYEILPYPALVKVMVRATATTIRMAVFSGSETIQEESPIQGGGTAGGTPSELNTAPIQWEGAAGDRVKLAIRSTDAGGQTVDGIVYVYPL